MSNLEALPAAFKSQTPEWLEAVARHAAGLRFGSVQILIHDGRVTQVESIRKTRFVPAPEQMAARTAAAT